MEISTSSRICTTTTRFRTLTSKFSNNICLALPSAATTPVAMLVTSLVTYTREISSGSPTSSASRPPPNWLRSYSRPSLRLQTSAAPAQCATCMCENCYCKDRARYWSAMFADPHDSVCNSRSQLAEKRVSDGAVCSANTRDSLLIPS